MNYADSLDLKPVEASCRFWNKLPENLKWFSLFKSGLKTKHWKNRTELQLKKTELICYINQIKLRFFNMTTQ